MKKIFIISIISLIFLSNFVGFGVLAQTEIVQLRDCHYQIIVKIVFDFKGESAQKKADFLIAKWSKGMNEIWNGDFGSKISSQNYLIDYNFILEKMAEGQTCSDYPQSHCIAIVSSELNKRGNRADVAMTMANNSANSQGEWTIATDGLNAAHEVGHLMGLRDEYHYETINGNKKWINDNYKKRGPQSIMAQTWDVVAAFSEHTDRILQNANLNLGQNKTCSQNEIFIWRGMVSKFYVQPIKIQDSRPELELIFGALIKGETDSAVYLVDQKGELRHLANENIAEKIAGPDWATKIIWLNDAIIYTYQFGNPILDN